MILEFFTSSEFSPESEVANHLFVFACLNEDKNKMLTKFNSSTIYNFLVIKMQIFNQSFLSSFESNLVSES